MTARLAIGASHPVVVRLAQRWQKTSTPRWPAFHRAPPMWTAPTLRQRLARAWRAVLAELKA